MIIPIVFFTLFILLLFYCYFQNQFWDHKTTKDFNSLREYKTRNIYGFRGQQILVHKDFIPHLIRLNKIAENKGIELCITQSYRQPNQIIQGAIVAPVSNSNHIAGYGIDMNLKVNGNTFYSNDLKKKNFKKVPQTIKLFFKDIRNDKSLRWGGDFTQEDPVHLDVPLNLLNKENWNNNTIKCFNDFSKASPKWYFWK